MKSPPSSQSILLVCTLCLVAQHYLITNGWIQHVAVGTAHDLVGLVSDDAKRWLFARPGWVANVTWALANIFLLGLLPAVLIRLVCGLPLSDYGLRIPATLPVKLLLGLCLVIVLSVYIAQHFEGFKTVYPFYTASPLYPDWLLFELLYCIQFVALEFFFRGALLHGLASHIGRTAVWVTTVPYVMVHFQKPWPETFGSLVAGIVLAELSLQTRSIWPGTALHLVAALAMDIMAISLMN